MQGDPAFPLLNDAGLRALDLLGTPLYIYSFDTQRICWSNMRAREFWNAESAEELHERVLTPYSLSTSLRLSEYRNAFRRGERRLETWTYYPKGKATAALARCSGVSIAGHDEAMLVEIQALTPNELPISELRAIEALRHSPLMISLYSDNGAPLMRNPAAQDCFEDMDKALPPGADHFRSTFADTQQYERLLAESAKSGTAQQSATMATRGAPIHSVQVRMVSDPVTGGPAMLVTQQDVSQLVRISRQLAASEQALDAVLSLNVAPTIVLSATDDSVLKTNFAADSLLGPRLSSGLGGSSAQYDALRGAVLLDGAGTTQLRLPGADGRFFWASVSGARITYGQEDAIVLLITNIDHIYQTAADLEEALGHERQTNATQRRYLAIASHEFRTPLAIIDGIAQRLARGADKLPPEQVVERATRIRSTVKRLLDLLDSTLGRALGNQGTMSFSPKPSQLTEIVDDAVSDFRNNNPAARIDMHLPSLPDLNLDRRMIEQALINLLSNSMKYSGGAPHIDISAVASSDDVQITLRDRGIGIPKQERARIFSDYVRGSNVGDRPGTGLGLAIVRQIVSLHGGSIEVVDTDGPGTSIRITLPRP